MPDYEVEFPYPLTCPGQVLKRKTTRLSWDTTSAGMMNNWNNKVQDQLHTLNKCGLGATLDKFFFSYSPANATNELDDLKLLLQQWSLNNTKTELALFPSTGSPLEGAAMNSLRNYCRLQRTSTNATTVVFYWHTKGSSHWTADWRQKMERPWTYSRVLYWRKYMEYFFKERPSYCIDQIVNKGAMTCGVHHILPAGIYGGNFWVASCRHMAKLPQLKIYPIREGMQVRNASNGYYNAEMVFGKYQNERLPWLYVSLHDHQPDTIDLYKRLYHPSEYSHAIGKMGPDIRHLARG